MALSKLALALAVAPSAALVAPSAKVASTKLSAEGKLDEIPEDTNRFTSRLATQEGFCLDLPGALAPMGQWDPAGFTSEASDNDIRRYREAETQHGRVAMLAVIGFLVAESWHPLFADVTGPAIDHLTQVRQEYPAFFEIGALVIGGLEVNRALVGWAFPDSREKVRAPRPFCQFDGVASKASMLHRRVGSVTRRDTAETLSTRRDAETPSTRLAEAHVSLSTQAGLLNEDYYPGDVGFDPLGLKPTDPEAFAEMQTKELQNGSLAMLAAAGFLAQELVNHKPILETLKLLILDDSEISKNLGINLCGNQMTRRIAIDATPARWRGGVGLSRLEHPTHWLICAQASTSRRATSRRWSSSSRPRRRTRSSKREHTVPEEAAARGGRVNVARRRARSPRRRVAAARRPVFVSFKKSALLIFIDALPPRRLMTGSARSVVNKPRGKRPASSRRLLFSLTAPRRRAPRCQPLKRGARWRRVLLE